MVYMILISIITIVCTYFIYFSCNSSLQRKQKIGILLFVCGGYILGIGTQYSYCFEEHIVPQYIKENTTDDSFIYDRHMFPDSVKVMVDSVVLYYKHI